MPRETITLPLSEVEEGIGNLRSQVDRKSIHFENLKVSMQTRGQITPISVRREVDEVTGKVRYVRVDGLHRFTILEDLGVPTVDCVISESEADEDLVIEQLAANTTVPTTRSQKAAAIRALIQKKGQTLQQAATVLGMTVPEVTAILNLTDLPESVQKLVDAGRVPVQAIELLRKVAPDDMDEWVKKALTLKTSQFVADCQEHLKDKRAEKQREAGPRVEKEFEKKPLLRKLAEVKDAQAALDLGTLVPDILAGLTVADIPDSDETMAVVGVVLNWTLGLDPVSVAAEKAKFDQQKAREAEAREKREREKAEKEAAKALSSAAEPATQE